MKIKGVSHIHSEYSYDAKLSLVELKNLFKKEGFSFALMTEHTDEITKGDAKKFIKDCVKNSDKDFIFIPGFEVVYKKSHILMIDAKEFVVSFANEITLREWKENSSFCVLAHPHRNHFIVDMAMSSVLDAIEIWNSHYDGKRVPRTKAFLFFNKLKKKNSELKVFGGLDLHRTEHLGGPEIILDIEKLNKESILKRIKNGEYMVKKGGVEISSKGEVIKNIPLSNIKSTLSVLSILIGKNVSKLFANLGISLPSSLKRIVRTKI